MQFKGLAALPVAYMDAYNRGRWSGYDPIQCERNGGTVKATSVRFMANGQPDPEFPVSFGCDLPQPGTGRGGDINVTVPTNVISEVSPQVSPNLTQQQDSPSSPVSAGTRQSGDEVSSNPNLLDFVRMLTSAPQQVQPVQYAYPAQDYADNVETPAPGEEVTPVDPIQAGIASVNPVMAAAVVFGGIALFSLLRKKGRR